MKADEKTKGYAEKLVTLLAKKTDTDISKYDIKELTQGMLVELEHGSENPETDITGDDPIETFKIVLVHLEEISDYYTRLEKMEKEAGSVKTDKKEENIIEESVKKRFTELCGITENKYKKQLKNTLYQESRKKVLLKEEIDPNKFDIVKFSNDGFGEKNTDEEIDLYKMKRKLKKY